MHEGIGVERWSDGKDQVAVPDRRRQVNDSCPGDGGRLHARMPELTGNALVARGCSGGTPVRDGLCGIGLEQVAAHEGFQIASQPFDGVALRERPAHGRIAFELHAVQQELPLELGTGDPAPSEWLTGTPIEIPCQHRLEIRDPDPAGGEVRAVVALRQKRLGVVEPRGADNGLVEGEILEALERILRDEGVDRSLRRQEPRGGGDHLLEVGVVFGHRGPCDWRVAVGRGSAARNSDRAATSGKRSWRKGRRRTTARRRRAQRAGGGPREDETDPRAGGAAAGAGSRRPEPPDRSSEARCDVATRCNSRPDASSLSSSSNCSVGAPESLSRLPLSGDASPAEIEIAADRASAKASRSPATTVARTARAIRRLRSLKLMSDELCDRNQPTVVSLRHRAGGGQSRPSRAGFGHPNRLSDSPHRGRDCALDGGAGFLPRTQQASVSVSCRPAVADLRGMAGAGDGRQAAAVAAACPLGRPGRGTRR